MATFNGVSYLQEQVTSILLQLGVNDELVVVDDRSEDGTVAFLKSLGDSRIFVYLNEVNVGHVQSFARAIGLATHPYILMSDQDDIWIDGRLNIMRDFLAAGYQLVSSNSIFIDGEGYRISALHPDILEDKSFHYIRNVIRIFSGKASYYGCAMGLRSEIRRLILPIPSYVESHDLWIALAANLLRSNYHLGLPTLRRRIHGGNVSVLNRPLLPRMYSRLVFFRSLLHIVLRLCLMRFAQHEK